MRHPSEAAHRGLATLVHYRTFETFAKAMVNSGDVAAEVLLLRAIAKREGLQLDWLICLFSVYGDVQTAVIVARYMPTAADFRLPLVDEASKNAHLFYRHGTYSQRQSLKGKLKALNHSLKYDRWAEPREALLSKYAALPFQTERSAAALLDLMAVGLSRPNLDRASLGLTSSDVNATHGPQAGCRALYVSRTGYRFDPHCYEQFNALGQSIARRLSMGMGHVAVCLTKWAMVVRGSYFIGHDIYCLRELAETLLPDNSFRNAMAAAGFAKALYTPRLDIARCRAAYAREGLLLNRHHAKAQPRLV